jgi:hypothetical protein
VQATKITMSVLKIVPIPEAVVVPRVSEQVKDGTFTPKDVQVDGARAMLDELKRWAEALKPLRAV